MKIRHSTLICLTLLVSYKSNSKPHLMDSFWDLSSQGSLFVESDILAQDHILSKAQCFRDNDSFSSISIYLEKPNVKNLALNSTKNFKSESTESQKNSITPLPKKEQNKHQISQHAVLEENSIPPQKKDEQTKALRQTSTSNSVINSISTNQASTTDNLTTKSNANANANASASASAIAMIASNNENNIALESEIKESITTLPQSTPVQELKPAPAPIEVSSNASAGLNNLPTDDLAALELADSLQPVVDEPHLNSATALSQEESISLSSLPQSEIDALDLADNMTNASYLPKEDLDALSLNNKTNEALADASNKVDLNPSIKNKSASKVSAKRLKNLSVTTDLKYTHDRQNDILKGAINLSWQHQFNGKVKILVRNRLSSDIAKRTNNRETTNYLQEMYVSTSATDTLIIDAGRINNRKGIAIGFNPNDYLAVEQTTQNVSFDPEVSRKARLGNVSLNISKFWDKSALNLIASPKLSDIGKDNSSDLQLANSNPDLRFIISLHLEYITNLSAEVLTYLSKEDHPQFGFNLSFPIKDDIVAYTEASTGKKDSTFNKLINKEDNSWHSQFVVGARWTPVEDFTVTGEFLYDDSGLSSNEIELLQTINPEGYQKLKQLKLVNQQMFGKYATFTRIDWSNFLVDNLKFSAFNMYDLKDDSFINWFELRYRYNDFDFAVQYFDPHQQKNIAKKEDHVISTEINYYY